MFEQTFLTDAKNGKRALSVLASCSAQIIVVLLLLIVPMIYTESLPSHRRTMLLPPPPNQPLASEPLQRAQTQPASSRTLRPFSHPLVAPARTPARVLIIDDMAAPFRLEGLPVGSSVPAGNACCGVPGGIGLADPPPPAPPPAEPRPIHKSDPVQVGGDVQHAKLLRQPLPTYPALARQARIAGVVRLLGIIGKDGTIQQLRVLSGHPLLAPSAIAAVWQWIYRPTLLNGQPVEVIAPIDVNFKLND